nr:serine/threonine-protein kinase [Kibdelosporangium phytohabitans]
MGSGTRVTDTLVVDRLLGEGAYAEVYRVRHRYLSWQAMKVFKQVATRAGTDALLGEARLLSTLGHPNIVRLFDAGTLDTPGSRRGYFTMEYIAGGSLRRLVRAHSRTSVPLDAAVRVIEQMTDGLAAAHRQSPPILHRDLTLDNVLVGYEESGMRVRLSDFGLSKRADPLTRLASAQGTYAFMAPEVQRGEGYSTAGDVWALGTIAYVLLTGKHPFDDGKPMHVYEMDRYRTPPLAPSRFNDNVDTGLDRVVLGALATDPAKRTRDAVTLAEALRGRHRRLPNWPVLPEYEPPAGPGERRAAELVQRAMELARYPVRLRDAADLLEEAVSLSAIQRARHMNRLALWRRGVMM